MALLMYMVTQPNMLFAAILTGVIIILQLGELFRFVSQTNRKLTRFLESVKYSDFISGFTNDNKLGKSFKDLNLEFNEVLEAFRKARAEKEEQDRSGQLRYGRRPVARIDSRPGAQSRRQRRRYN